MSVEFTGQLVRYALSDEPTTTRDESALHERSRTLIASAVPDGTDRVVGVEVAARVIDAIGPALDAAGWDAASIAAGLGAAAAHGHAAHLTEPQLARALSIVATQSTGRHPDSVSAAALAFQRRRALANAVEAVQLAATGFTAPETGLGGRRGLIAVMVPSEGAHPAGAR
jgi:2-methylcitrate dehydratase PrpD